jgi:hypothetical protein
MEKGEFLSEYTVWEQTGKINVKTDLYCSSKIIFKKKMVDFIVG